MNDDHFPMEVAEVLNCSVPVAFNGVQARVTVDALSCEVVPSPLGLPTPSLHPPPSSTPDHRRTPQPPPPPKGSPAAASAQRSWTQPADLSTGSGRCQKDDVVHGCPPPHHCPHFGDPNAGSAAALTPPPPIGNGNSKTAEVLDPFWCFHTQGTPRQQGFCSHFNSCLLWDPEPRDVLERLATVGDGGGGG